MSSAMRRSGGSAVPFVEAAPFDRMQWTFQSEATDWPGSSVILEELNQLSVPCTWRKAALKRGRHAVTSMGRRHDLAPGAQSFEGRKGCASRCTAPATARFLGSRYE